MVAQLRKQRKVGIYSFYCQSKGVEIMRDSRISLPEDNRIVFLARIHWNEKMVDINRLQAFLRKHFPVEFWETFSMVSAISPLFLAIFVVNDLKSVDQIIKEIRKEPYVTSVVIKRRKRKKKKKKNDLIL